MKRGSWGRCAEMRTWCPKWTGRHLGACGRWPGRNAPHRTLLGSLRGTHGPATDNAGSLWTGAARASLVQEGSYLARVLPAPCLPHPPPQPAGGLLPRLGPRGLVAALGWLASALKWPPLLSASGSCNNGVTSRVGFPLISGPLFTMNQCVKMSTPANSPGGQSDLWSPEEYSSETIHKLEALPLTTRWTVESTKYKSQQTLGAGRGFSPVWPWASHLPSVWCSFFLCSIFKVKKRWLCSPSLFLNSVLDLEKAAKTPQSNPLLVQISSPGYLLF